jgi:pimeloyl-ACP methyl ester carboxylesterase
MTGSGFACLSDGGKIAYAVHGSAHAGTPILLMRPLGGTMALWGSYRAILAETHRVVSFDPRGSGQSSSTPWVTTRALARDAVAVLDDLGVRQAHVFGISLGGMAATWLAILAPSRVVRLCIASAPARGLEWSHAGLRRELSLAACLLRPERDVEAALVRHILSRPFRTAHADAVRSIERIVRAQPSTRAALVKHALAGALHDARGQIAAIRAPSLVLAGERDHLVGTEHVRALADAIPVSVFDVIAAAGHDITLEQPEATAERLLRFLRGSPTG